MKLRLAPGGHGTVGRPYIIVTDPGGMFVAQTGDLDFALEIIERWNNSPQCIASGKPVGPAKAKP